MDYIKKCTVCEKLFIPQKTSQTCCSSECGLKQGHILNNNRKKYYICQHCGKEFWRPNAFRMKFCGKECEIAERHAIAEERKKSCQPKEKTIYHRTCPVCNIEFDTIYPNKICCCKTCGYKLSKQKHREKWKEEYVPQIFICRECGCVVSTECGKKCSEFCSQRCAEKYHARAYKMRRNEQMKSAYRKPVSFNHIYCRDHGVCGICGLPVPYDKSPENLWSATIDHIVPLSKGGTHEPDNCQLTHRLCNSLKLVEAQDFRIDWKRKNIEDDGRWTKTLGNLYDIVMSKQKGVVLPGGQGHISTTF